MKKGFITIGVAIILSLFAVGVGVYSEVSKRQVFVEENQVDIEVNDLNSSEQSSVEKDRVVVVNKPANIRDVSETEDVAKAAADAYLESKNIKGVWVEVKAEAKGKIDGEYYINEHAGFRFKIPKGWLLISDHWFSRSAGEIKAVGEVSIMNPIYNNDPTDKRNPAIKIYSSHFPKPTWWSFEETVKQYIQIRKQSEMLDEEAGYDSFEKLIGYTPYDPKSNQQHVQISLEVNQDGKIFHVAEHYTGAYDISLSILKSDFQNLGFASSVYDTFFKLINSYQLQ